MSTIAFDQFALTRIADFARTLSRLHQASRRRAIDDDEIDREFNAVCMAVPLTQQLRTPLLWFRSPPGSWDEGARIPPARKKWHPSGSAVQSLEGSAGDKFGPNVYKLSIETHQMMH